MKAVAVIISTSSPNAHHAYSRSLMHGGNAAAEARAGNANVDANIGRRLDHRRCERRMSDRRRRYAALKAPCRPRELLLAKCGGNNSK